MLRAKILHTCRPELSARAWYRAWCCDPENPALQDLLLQAWLDGGASASVLELGPSFLPARCRSGQHASLLTLLHRAGMRQSGACWKADQYVEGILFLPPLPDGTAARVRLLLSDETMQYQFDVFADGSRFRLAPPTPDKVWSITMVTAGAAKPQLLQGSPLSFYPEPSIANAAESEHDASHARAGAAARPQVAIIIPVYRDNALVQACIASVQASLPLNRAQAELIVIDDASPEPALSAWLDGQAAAGRLTLLRNHANLGFIETVNRGMRHRPGYDVLLLNADTLVHSDWIDRLSTALYSAPDVASVTPWSNNGEISSFPKIAFTAPAPNFDQLAQLDRTAAAVRAADAGADVELPSCCGFTMLIRRSVLAQIGLFDGAGLVRGYGEEVDWCLRARAAGYRHLAATAVFVAHTGTVSFRFEKKLRVRQNRNILTARYPGYYAEYHRFLREDPLAQQRAALRQTLDQAGDAWLSNALHSIESRTELAAALPAAIATRATRIAVWQHHAASQGAPGVLALARLIASQPACNLRLLIIGAASEALWHTGVVDVLPSGTDAETALLTDAAIIGLSGCVALLSDGATPAPDGIQYSHLNTTFDAAAWLTDWLDTKPTAPVVAHTGV